MATSEQIEDFTSDQDAINYFLSLKTKYKQQRQSWEQRWDQALASVYITNELNKTYVGRADSRSPIQNWKVKNIVARLARVLFGAVPFGRIEDTNVENDSDEQENIVDLWNKYIFNKQLGDIEYKKYMKQHMKNKTIQGTGISKVTQEFETKEMSFFDGEEDEEVVVKDNTFFKPLLIKEFYSDVTKYDINESQACIHSTILPVDEIRKNKKRKEKVIIDLIDPQTKEVVGQDEEMVEEGLYKNVDLILEGDKGNNFTPEQADYTQKLGLSPQDSNTFMKSLKENMKTGFVEVDEIYGKYVLDGELKEVICVIANGRVILRLEETPFKHKRFVRPFIVGRYEEIPGCLYGTSPVLLGQQSLYELNATKSQSVDAKTRAVANMWYQDESKNVVWDKTWTPNGIVKGNGPNGLQPILTPYLGNITTKDAIDIERDINQLWSLSPLQEATSDPSMIPNTRGGTLAVIAQNDFPINELINRTIDEEIKPFLEMIYERNLVFKSPEDLLSVWDKETLEQSGLDENTEMKALSINPSIKILGNLELSNELSHQAGYTQFINFAQSIPPIARRIDWREMSEKMLKSYGIKDDADDIFLNEDEVQKQLEQEQKAAEQAAQQEAQQLEQLTQQELAKAEEEKRIDVEGNIVEENAINTHKSQLKTSEQAAEVQIETISGKKVA